MIFNSKKIKELRENLDSNLKDIKEQFTQHLDSINDNTNEIQANYEYTTQLDNKIEKLAQRLDQIQLFLKQLTDRDVAPNVEEYQVQELTLKEKQVFLVLYPLDANKVLSYRAIASEINLTESLVKQYVTNLIEKGIPIIKEYRLGKPYLRLDPKFKELQAKQNILNIEDKKLLVP